VVCLETDFLIAILRKDEGAIRKLEEFVERGETLTTTPINASELFRGAYLSKNIEENLKAVRGILSRLDLLNFNLVASEIYGRVCTELKKRGCDIGEFDILIASIALAHNERIITRNVKHFSKIGELEVESW